MSTSFHAGGSPRRNSRRRPSERDLSPTTHHTSSPAGPGRVLDTPPSAASFVDLGVPAPLVTALAGLGVTTPFPVQAASMHSSLAGRDVLGRGRTGSGKTVAFAVPTVAALAASSLRQQARRPRSLILVPTRELAAQVAAVVVPLAKVMDLRVAFV